MAFIRSGQTVLSFAEYQDVLDRDQRLFEANEGLTDDVVEDSLIRATERILTEIRATDWWKSYYKNRDSSISYVTSADIPGVNASKIAARQNDFTDLCVFKALSEYILPKIADFGSEENAEKVKMSYYTQRANSLFAELITAGDWYDFSGDGNIVSSEKEPGQINFRRVR